MCCGPVVSQPVLYLFDHDAGAPSAVVYRHFGICPVDGLVNTDQRQEIVLEDKQVQQQTVAMPCDDADHGARDGVQDEVVRSRHDGEENECRVRHADDDNGKTFPGARA